MPKKGPSTSRKKFLSRMSERLEGMKEKIVAEMSHAMRSEREGVKDEGMDTYDLASEERDREISFILSDRERAKMSAIDDAMERIGDGSYGVCESCGLEIGEERMEALPFTRLCRDCQQDMEREARTQRRTDDDRAGYRKFGSTEADEENT